MTSSNCSARTVLRGRWAAWLLCVAACLAALPATAQTTIMCVGDSITQGGFGRASYRYFLYFDLLGEGHNIDMVGSRDALHLNNIPNGAVYPDYLTTFDRDHEAYWGFRTDEVEPLISSAAMTYQPDIVLLKLGTNDIGQLGAAGIAPADQNIRDIIGLLRAQVPNVTILLGHIIPIDPGTSSSYGANEAQVGPWNAALDTIAADLDTVNSPVVIVDHNTGFNLGSMMSGDGLHPNETGEQFIADNWRTELANHLGSPNPPPSVSINVPVGGASFSDPATVSIEATASDPNGSVSTVRFFVNGVEIASDTTVPYATTWNSTAPGSYTLTAEAEDDEGATTLSAPVMITVVSGGTPVPIAVANHSFETPSLPNSDVELDNALIPDWDFVGTTNTFVGIFNPPTGSYPEAGGSGTPIGADGAQVAFLFNDGGPAEMVSATQALGENVVAGRDYTLTVAIGRFDPSQPYSPSTYGGYTIELLAGTTVIASDTDSITPPELEFADAMASVAAEAIPPGLIGEPLSIRLGISATVTDRSTHFDNVRLAWSEAASLPVPSLGALGGAVLAVLVLGSSGWALTRTRDRSQP